MNRFLRFCAWLFLLIVFLVSVAFSFLNTDDVSLSLGFVVFGPQPLSLWVIAGFVFGGVIGILVGAGFFRHLLVNIEVQRLRSRLVLLEKDNASLRADLYIRQG